MAHKVCKIDYFTIYKVKTSRISYLYQIRIGKDTVTTKFTLKDAKAFCLTTVN